MKKLFLITLLAYMTGSTAFSQQPACLRDVSQTLDRGYIGKAKNEIDKCMIENEASADAWLVKANVYSRFYLSELEKKTENPTYEIKNPYAILDACDAFYKALTLNKDVKPMAKMLGPIDGQKYCAPDVLDLAYNEMSKRNYEKAIECFNVAIRGLNLANDKFYTAHAQMGLANCYLKQNDTENYLKSLESAVRLAQPIPDLYILLYDYYKENNDTTQCARIIRLGKTAVHDTIKGAAELRANEIDFLAITGRVEEIPDLAVKLYEANKDNSDVIYYISLHLVNNGFYELATPMIERGLLLGENPLGFNRQMGFRYFYESVHYQSLIEEAVNAQNWAKSNELEKNRKEVMEIAHEWLEKVYEIDNNDVDNNIMLKRIKLVLNKPIPDELEEKVNSYRR